MAKHAYCTWFPWDVLVTSDRETLPKLPSLDSALGGPINVGGKFGPKMASMTVESTLVEGKDEQNQSVRN